MQLTQFMTKERGRTCIELDLLNFNALFEHVCDVMMHYIFDFLHFLIHSTQLVNLAGVLIFLARILEQLPTLAIQVSIFFISRNTSTLRWKLTIEIIGERRQKTVMSWCFQLRSELRKDDHLHFFDTHRGRQMRTVEDMTVHRGGYR